MQTVLMVDDDGAFVSILAKALLPYGYQVEHHARLKGAVERINEIKPQIVSLDVMLPDGSGYQIARQMRKDHSLYRTPILFVSALSDEPEIKHALAQGADAYLGKPFTIQQILDRLSRLHLLGEKVHAVDRLTGFLTMEATEKEIEHLLFREEEFHLCYMSIDNFDKYSLGKGGGEAERVIQWMAAQLRHTLKSMGLQDGKLSHLGLDHFLVILPGKAHHFWKEIAGEFELKRREFYKEFEIKDGYSVVSAPGGVYSGHALMELRVDMVHCQNGSHASKGDLLHDLQDAHKHGNHDKPKTVFRWKQGEKW